MACAALIVVASAARAVPSVDDFLAEADIRDIELSPDGTHLAMVTSKDGERYIVVRDITDPAMPVVGALGGDLVRPNYLYWGNDERLLVAMSVPADRDQVEHDRKLKEDFDLGDYYMLSRMISVRKDMSDMVILMEDERRLRGNRSLSRITNFLPNDADHVLMAAYRRGRRIQYRVDITTGAAEKVITGSSRTFRFVSDEDGNPRFRIDYLPRSQAIVLYRFTEKGRWKKFEKIYLNKDDEESIGAADLVAVNDDGLVYRRRNDETGFFELIAVDKETGDRTPLVSLDRQDVAGVVTDLRSDSLVGYTVEKDYIRHVYFDEARQRQYDAIAAQIGDYNFSLVGYADDRGVALLRSTGPDNPSAYHLWDAKAQQLTLLAHAYGRLATGNLAVPGLATYATRDGVPIRGYLLFPPDYEPGTPHPTVLLPHGGPHTRSRASYNTLAQFFATRGYVVMQPNFRGSTGYGRDFEAAGYRQWGGVMQDDVTDAVTFLVNQGIADPERVCIVGASYGGYAALMGAVKTPELFRCAASLNGVTHLAELVSYTMRNGVDRDDWETVLFDRIGHPKDDEARLDANSPALHADRIRIPVLLIAGTEDTRVPFEQAELMAEALSDAGADFRFIELSGAGHNPFRSRAHAVRVLEALEAFLGAHLQ